MPERATAGATTDGAAAEVAGVDGGGADSATPPRRAGASVTIGTVGAHTIALPLATITSNTTLYPVWAAGATASHTLTVGTGCGWWPGTGAQTATLHQPPLTREELLRRYAPAPARPGGAIAAPAAYAHPLLTGEERAELARRGYLAIPSRSRRHPGRLYTIPAASGGQVAVWEPMEGGAAAAAAPDAQEEEEEAGDAPPPGRRLDRFLCLQPVEALDTPDWVACQKLLLTADEGAYLRRANHFAPHVYPSGSATQGGLLRVGTANRHARDWLPGRSPLAGRLLRELREAAARDGGAAATIGAA